MITLHAHADSLLTFTIEWWPGSRFWVQMFLPNGDNYHLDRATDSYEDALAEGVQVCDEAHEYFSRDSTVPYDDDELYSHLIPDLGGEE